MPTTQNSRRQWMSVLAQAPAGQLIELAQPFLALDRFTSVRAPEIGLAQVRARMGGTGNRFNLGDVTITRCVVQSANGHYGYAYIRGRNKPHALCAAQLDALLQSDNHREAIYQQVIKPLRQTLAQQQQQRATEAAATRVNFFTLVRGED
ncbi:phosphonate C-P lyase system protein PhnG [Sedimenticola thiotaurini]|uniref:Phosphonate C-P lyase n=1 Tax=Sedimenticola thiotaurini TaxID=1543721 RepID=A0A0F7K2V4_9GAMM|nr:phosphonate C-P lyase system protein PhnG [Sedimenticola thiotaurini]AKH21904.1 phosphonate C-P lyase [Sedimenticola thiotaurini]